MSSSEKAGQPVEIWFTRCGGATASSIAIQKKWLHEEFLGSGITLSSVLDNPNLDVRESHFDHSIKSMFREGGNIPPIWARANGVDTVTLGITWVDEYQAIVTRPDSDIRDVSDLKGRRLAVPLRPNASIDFFRGSAFHGFANALSIAGLGRDDVNFIDVAIEGRGPSGSAELAALAKGDVDAVFLRQGSGAKLAREHAGEIRQLIKLTDEADPFKRVNNGTPRPITTHREFLNRHPDLVVRYLAVLLRSAAWAEANPVEAIHTIAAEDGRVGEDIIAEAYPRLAVSLTPKLTRDYVAGLEAQKNFLRDWGFLAGDFEIGDWIEEGPLEEARRLIARDARVAA